MHENAFLNSALELVRLGYAVLPLRPGEKIPFLKGGVQDRLHRPSAGHRMVENRACCERWNLHRSPHRHRPGRPRRADLAGQRPPSPGA